MPEKTPDTSIVDKAVIFAVMKHANTNRKGTEIPYIVHPMEAAAIVAGVTNDREMIAAAVLHDTLEDTGTTSKELKKLFGERIMKLVEAESEKKQGSDSIDIPWEERKLETIRRLKKEGTEARKLALGDKLSNIRAIERDFAEKGDEFWDRFNQKDPKKQAWYYGNLAKVFHSDEELKDTHACREYVRLVDKVFGIDSLKGELAL